jgi:alkylation response protein AidB-like acyl-CoA dehydrogenase
MSNYFELPLTGLQDPLSEMEAMVQMQCRKFAKTVLRPIGIELDKMNPEAAIAPDSPLWGALEKASELGLRVTALAELPPVEATRILALASEELSWGDAGIAGAILVGHMPVLYSMIAGNTAMAEYCEGKRGCWAITEPDHGSDQLDASGAVSAVNGNYGRPNCIARIEGDKVVINGQKSAWVSGAMTAEVCALYCHAEVDGKTLPGIAVIVPLDAKGVSRGKPLDKIGLRGLNQGELYFDNVEVPIENLLAGPDTYIDFAHQTLAAANPHVGTMFIGVARAAYEHALAYAHERIQGGVPIIQHQHVQFCLFEMFRKIEAARALVMRAMIYNATAEKPALHGSIASKVTATQTAFEVASEAMQIFGGNGVTKEYPMEKLLRDARVGLIADGINEVLSMKGGSMLMNPALLANK